MDTTENREFGEEIVQKIHSQVKLKRLMEGIKEEIDDALSNMDSSVYCDL